jgi:hypothetical protein
MRGRIIFTSAPSKPIPGNGQHEEMRTMTTRTFRDHRGDTQNYAAAVALMDEGLREVLHGELAGCTNQEFMEAYSERHLEQFGAGFAPYHGGEW